MTTRMGVGLIGGLTIIVLLEIYRVIMWLRCNAVMVPEAVVSSMSRLPRVSAVAIRWHKCRQTLQWQSQH